MVSLLHIKAQLEELYESLDSVDRVWNMLAKEKPQDAADLVQLMAEVSGSLMLDVRNFFAHWDFAEDCRRAAVKEAAEATAGGVR